MTTASLPFRPFLDIHDTLDRGLSAEAERLRHLFSEPPDASWSVSLDERRARLLQSLEDAFLEARHEDWDGEGSAAADPLSFVYASAFLLSLPGWVPNPEITVDPDGELSAEWDYGARAVFSVSVARDGTLTYAGLFGASKSHGVEPFTDAIPEIVTQSIKRAIAQ